MYNHPSNTLVCEILADPATAGPLAAITQTCAADVGLPLVLELNDAHSTTTPAITFRVPVEPFSNRDGAHSLARRVASFCPHVLVTVIIEVPRSGMDALHRLARAEAA